MYHFRYLSHFPIQSKKILRMTCEDGSTSGSIILAYVLHYVAAQRARLSVDKYSFCCFQQVEQSLWKQDPPGPETFSMWQRRALFWLVWLSFNLKLKLGICDWKFMLTLQLSCKCHFRGIFNHHHIIFIIYVWWTDDDLYRHYNTTCPMLIHYQSQWMEVI